jgi:thioredoxin-related protein
MLKRNTILVLSVFVAAWIACGSGKVEKGKTDGWLAFNEGMELAAKTGKPVIIDFYTSWCRWCRVMDSETFSNADVKKILEKEFITIRVDAEDKTDKLEYIGNVYTPVQLTRHFAVKGFPSLAYLESSGKKIMVVPGFKKPEEFLMTLSYVSEGCYRKNITLDSYLQKGGNCN